LHVANGKGKKGGHHSTLEKEKRNKGEVKPQKKGEGKAVGIVFSSQDERKKKRIMSLRYVTWCFRGGKWSGKKTKKERG